MSNKFLSLFVAALLLTGFATESFATVIPSAEDPLNGSQLSLKPVYNNSGAALSAGDVVVWDISNSTGDDDNYVTTTTTGDTVLVAGVVYRNSIPAASTGYIVVNGVVPVNIYGGGNTVNGPLCSSTVAGKARSCLNNDVAFGYVTTVVDSSNQANTYIKNIN